MRLENLYLEAVSLGRGFIESEAFGGTIPTFPAIMKIHGPTREQNIIPDGDPPHYHVYRLEFPNNLIDQLAHSISIDMIGDGWYSLLWTEEFIIIIIKDDIFKLPRNTKQIPLDIQRRLIEYGTPAELMPFILDSPAKF